MTHLTAAPAATEDNGAMADDVTTPTREGAGAAGEVRHSSAAVVAAVDGSVGDPTVIDWAADEAARSGRTLRLVHVVEPGYQLTPYEAVFGELPSLSEQLRANGHAVVDAAAERAAARHPGLEVERRVEWGPPAGVIIDVSDGAGWLVLGAPPRHRFERVLLGSVALATVAHARCPVAVVPQAHEVTAPHLVLVGVDGSSGSARAVELALATAAPVGGTIVCVIGWTVEVEGGVVVTEPGTDRWARVEERYARLVHETVDPLAARYPDVAVEVVVRSGGASRAVVEVAAERHADLVVVGSRGHGGFRGLLLGSVSRRVVERAGTVVAVVH